MSWQGFLLNHALRFGKWQLEHRSIPDITAAMRLYMNRIVELQVQPSDVACEAVILGGVPCEWVCVTETREAPGVVLYCHGGGYVAGSPASHRDLAWRLSRASGMRVLMVSYRLAPEYPYPAQREDAGAVYRALLDGGQPAGRIAFAGDSAGGGLVLGLALELRDLGLPLPAALVAFSPWADLTHSGATIRGNAFRDQMLPVHLLDQVAALVAGGTSLEDPLLSPVFADLHGLPPLQLHASADEVLLDDSRRLAARAQAAGVSVQLRIWERVPHAFPVLAQLLPEGRGALREAGAFLKRVMSPWPGPEEALPGA
jgi:acetyl esterase/lipase